jgi:gluconolactonase
MGAIRTLVNGLDHPEGVAYDPRSQRLWAGGEEGQLYRVDVDTGAVEEVGRMPGLVLGLAVDGRGRLVVCCTEDRSIRVWEGDRTRTILSEGLAFPNFPAFAADGTLFVSDSGRWTAGDGRLWRIDSDGSAEVFSDSPRDFPNGCAVSADGRILWLVESYVPNLTRYDLSNGNAELVVRIDGTVPDGLALTADGGLLISCYRPDRIYHLGPDGSLEIVAEDPQGTLLAAPTNVCFVGEGLDRVVAANYNRRHLTILDLGISGTPLHMPERWGVDAG